MNVLSLFDGSSIGYLALKEAGIEVNNYFASEIDEHAIKKSKENFPEIKHLGSVTDWLDWDLPSIDLVIGGSPCQGFSRQGIGLNFEDPRSKLFFDYVDILKHFKPKYFFLENVDMKKDWEDVITDYLLEKPLHVNSSLLIPQNRPRTYWSNFELKQPEQKEYSLLDYLDKNIEGSFDGIGKYFISDKYKDDEKNLVGYCDEGLTIKQATKIGFAVANCGDGVNLSFPSSSTRRGRVTKNKVACLDTSCNVSVLDEKGRLRKLSIKELERLQGYPEGLTNGLSESQAKKLIGNGWTLDVIVHFFKQLKERMG